MIVEIEEPEEPTDELSTTLSTTSYSDFTQFIEDLGQLKEQNLKFFQCNRFLKLKQADYVPDAVAIQYFKEVFSKKTNTSVRRKWHIKDKFILVWVVFKLCAKKGIHQLKMKYTDWDDVEKILKLPKQFLMRKWICLIRHTTYHFHWTSEEEQTLKNSMSTNLMEFHWSNLSLQIYKKSKSNVLRTCKDIRQHWKNYLDPNLKKTGWTEEEDFHLIQLVNANGKKWSLVSRLLEHRTQNQVKNRYLALIKKTQNKSLFSTQHSSSEESSQISQELQDDVKVEQNYYENVDKQKQFLVYETNNSANDEELQDYIHMPIQKCNMESGFFNDI